MYVASFKEGCPRCGREHLIGVFGETSGYAFPEPDEIYCPCGARLVVALDGYEVDAVYGAVLLIRKEEHK